MYVGLSLLTNLQATDFLLHSVTATAHAWFPHLANYFY